MDHGTVGGVQTGSNKDYRLLYFRLQKLSLHIGLRILDIWGIYKHSIIVCCSVHKVVIFGHCKCDV
uniref:Uncharacterized protein n=1 Tax=Arundo donax TaxID=35708 RepID=A0A0A9CAZ8_ARUDO